MTYTYQNGVKVPLTKSDSDFIVRSTPDQLADLGLAPTRQVSSASYRVSVDPNQLEDSMALARQHATTHHLYSREDSGDDFLISDRILVRFRPDVTEARQMEFAGEYGLLLKDRLSPRDALFQLTTETGCNPVKLIVSLTEHESDIIEFAEHDLNREIEPASLTLPTDPLYLRSWHLHQSLSDPDFDPRSSTQAATAWQLLDNFGSSDIVIGVTDDGCRLDHPDFPSGKFAGWAYLEGTTLFTNALSGDPSRMYEPNANHGTSCCGVAAGAVNAELTVGVAPGVRLLPVKWESSNRRLLISDSKLLKILSYLADKVDIISNSWGGVPTSVWSIPVIETIRTLALTGGRRGKGILFLFAAGNWNCPLNHTGSTPIPYTSGWALDSNNTPIWVGPRTSTAFSNNLVGLDGVLHIAALSSRATRSHYSCWGEGLALTASASNSHFYQRTAVPGLGVTAATGLPSLSRPDFGGTSCATPIVAGVAALALSANPDLTALELASLLKQTATKDLDFSPTPRTPAAVFDPNPTWDINPIPPHDSGIFLDRNLPDGTWSPWFGHGAVNAAAAVSAALARRAASPANQVTTYEARPDLLIPDNNTAGLSSTLSVNSPGLVRSLEVAVEITHTWIGDLRVSLTSPQGIEVLLHNRTGSSTKNINTTYRPDSTPALTRFFDQPASGPWRLRVADLAKFDSGRLMSWSLRFTLNAPTRFTDPTTVLIPDGDLLGITRSLTLPSSASGPLAVIVSLSHPNLADISLTLFTPTNTPVTLANPGDLTGEPLELRFTPPQLTAQPGLWQLTIRDEVSSAAGKLLSWSLELA